MSESSFNTFKIEPLKGNNWIPWKRRITAVLRELELMPYVTGAKKNKPLPRVTKDTDGIEIIENQKEIDEWETKDAKAQTRIELTISDSELIHLTGATTVAEMWTQLCAVKESKGIMGILAARRRLYRTYAEEGFSMVEHISTFRNIQEELALMGDKLDDTNFAFLLTTSLPESWDTFTSAYFGANSNKPTLSSYELSSILIEEERQRKEKSMYIP